MSSEPPTGDMTEANHAGPAAAQRRSSARTLVIALVALVIAIDVLAILFVPPFPAGGKPGDACDFPVCFIKGSLELPAPHVLWAPFGGHPEGLLTFHVSVSSSMFTMWLVSGVLLLAIILMSRGGPGVPGRLQNVLEWAYEKLHDFGTSLGGRAAAPYIPLFASFFLLILFSNWAGLVPPVGRVEFLRAPTSDVNVTIGLALISFAVFEIEGFRRLGARAYLAKFFPVQEFRNGIAAGAIAMFVGLVELMLDFVRPLTLSMRLFGNIYGGEVALGVITALTLAVLPVALLGLEFMLNFIQALIFSVLSLMYIVLAIESHGHEEGETAHGAVETAPRASHQQAGAAAAH
ncbi:MAG TPA: F0F1 ATP synthase subunit A [Candidatus Limnocylindrales bacterium]|nr:F0F1 ATP synthase subunit A [Candidatus Limnocylindrales bacterium]